MSVKGSIRGAEVRRTAIWACKSAIVEWNPDWSSVPIDPFALTPALTAAALVIVTVWAALSLLDHREA